MTKETEKKNATNYKNWLKKKTEWWNYGEISFKVDYEFDSSYKKNSLRGIIILNSNPTWIFQSNKA